MSFFGRETFRHGRFSMNLSPPPPTLSFLRWCLTTNASTKDHSFTVSYLVKECGLSSQSALSASKYVDLKNPQKPNSVLAFLRNHGFSSTQISNVVKAYPKVLLCSPEKTLLPKLEFLCSKGLSVSDAVNRLSIYPYILKCSLDKQIVPAFSFFSHLFKSDEKVLATMKRFVGVLVFDIEDYAAPNVNFLRETGVPESNIVWFVQRQPRTIVVNPVKFKAAVEDVKKMGFNPLQTRFVIAVSLIIAMSKSTWKFKVDLYKKWGWSEKEILAAFIRCPYCMAASVDKIDTAMDFFVNKMGWEPSLIAKYSNVISLSFKKRIVPRSSVAQVLASKGLLKKITLSNLFYVREEEFLERYVNCYEKEAPQLMKLYETKLGLLG